MEHRVERKEKQKSWFFALCTMPYAVSVKQGGNAGGNKKWRRR
jgi:hypothetical protein